ncbi:hypothetical protein HD806DRAFT_517142 [Xylariaceae sp. AK1471]|nr:hypothetical protein HD806DRAFT_517142 [Xylariaceae sp. AK1471]
MSNPSVKAEAYEPESFWVAPARNFRSSARLHLQHLLWQNTIGFLLEPRIQNSIADVKQLKVADLACGNGVWLTDLDHQLSNKKVSSQLDGYDINDVNFPPPAFLPNMVKLNKLDVLSRPLPEELIGAYDIVHIRAFSSIIFNCNTTPLLSTALAMLKPGGWLQWDEMGADFVIEPPSPDISKTACETIDRILKAGGETHGMKREFLRELDRHVSENGFQEVHLQEDKNRKQDYKGWTEDFLMVWEDLASFFPSKADKPEAPVTKEFWVDLFAKAVKETEQGVALFYRNMFTVVGRKPC